ncbi:MAG: M12 family metallo-peptidase [Deltaproteobacteria bacterium]|nr:M12 family metallo-peptidase [Deltaproteobacteria bacterium]
MVEREVRLTLRNLRNPALTEFVLKDGAAGSGSSMPLPAPATYQGTVRDGGVAVATVTAAAVEGSMLVAPEGWSFIEPLEPQLRLHEVEPGARRRLLRKYNHIVYNTRRTAPDQLPRDDPGRPPVVVGPPQPPAPLVMSVVADGDAALWRAYPLDSVMPFWLKQETLLNGVDWLYNCVEPDANAANAYAECDNQFDGGSGAFQARVRIDRLEVWTSGGPTAPTRRAVLNQSAAMTHQSSPLCCGPPHTAGRSSIVHFFSGTAFTDGAGEAFGIGGLNYYGPRCREDAGTGLCHHAVSQLVASQSPSFTFNGTAFEQLALVAHEIGHNNNANDIMQFEPVCWLFDTQCGQTLMFTANGFNGEMLFLYVPLVAEMEMGPLMASQLPRAPG